MLEIKAPAKGLVAHGVSTCAGCGLELALRVVLDVLGKNTVIVIPPGCAALFSGYGRETALRIPGFQGNLASTAAYAAGIRAGFELQGKGEITVLALAGDGATVDIGLQALSGAFERGDRIIYVCYDNEAYMNTGIQSSGSTPRGARTTTTPAGKTARRKDMMQIVAAHHIPYAATASVGFVDDLRRKVGKAKASGGPAYIHIHAPCPPGWGFSPAKMIAIAKLAVWTKSWMLYEIVQGREKELTVPIGKPRPVEDYLKLQNRFAGLTTADLQAIQAEVEQAYAHHMLAQVAKSHDDH